MSEAARYRTAQEGMWTGTFGTAHSERNAGGSLSVDAEFFARALRSVGGIASCLELGANIGRNLRARQQRYPGLAVRGVEINPDAARVLEGALGRASVHRGSLFDYASPDVFDLVLVKGVLIHVDPGMLPVAYAPMHRGDSCWSPSTRVLPSGPRGPAMPRLTIICYSSGISRADRYRDRSLRDDGFVYYRDRTCPQDDVNWFLLEKRT